jgi:ABC-2 type transport system ATP-binding protein
MQRSRARRAAEVGTAVELDRLTKRFGDFTAVDGITLDVQQGEIFGFLGANGAGKSTTIRMMCGLLRPSEGTARVLGIDVARDPEGVKRSIGYMSQRFSLYEDLTALQNIRFFGGVYGLAGAEARDRERWAVEMTGLAGQEHRLTRELPGGWRQKLALACAILHRPRVVFLDEPTSGVDPLSRRRFWALIDEMATSGVTVFVTTHYLDEAEYCHRLALIHAGKLAALGGVAELKEVFAGHAVLEVACPRPAEAQDTLEGQPWAREVAIFGTRLHVVVADVASGTRAVEAALAAAANGPAQVERIVPSLEDVFIHHVEEAEAQRAAAVRS